MNGVSLSDVDIALEGALIASEIVDNSDSMRDICSKCGTDCSPVQITRICEGQCRPSRIFHSDCLHRSQKTEVTFKCQICDPKYREDYCQSCRARPENRTLSVCKFNSTNGCQRYVHRECVPRGKTEYQCGVCNVAVI